MIVARAPLRVSLGGGGTDLPAYYERFGGFVLSVAIDRYTHATVNPCILGDVRFVHEEVERVQHARELRHPIAREALQFLGIDRGIDVTSISDLPGRTGLGSSGSFTVALLRALHRYLGRDASPRQLAEEACEIELQRLQEPAGKQDQYVAAHGGICALTFEPGGAVHVEAVARSAALDDALESRLVLAYSGVGRASRSVLGEQSERLRGGVKPTVEALHRIKALGVEALRMLRTEDLDGFGALMHEHWTHKQALASNVSSPHLDEVYEDARRAGALGGKVLGAGAGGFFLFYARDAARDRVCETLSRRGLRLVPFRVAPEGARLVVPGGIP